MLARVAFGRTMSLEEAISEILVKSLANSPVVVVLVGLAFKITDKLKSIDRTFSDIKDNAARLRADIEGALAGERERIDTVIRELQDLHELHELHELRQGRRRGGRGGRRRGPSADEKTTRGRLTDDRPTRR